MYITALWHYMLDATYKKFAVSWFPNAAKFSFQRGPHLCEMYETMNVRQLLIPVSDSGMDMKAPHDCRDPPLNTHTAKPFVSSQRKHFHFLDHVRAPSLFICNLRMFRPFPTFDPGPDSILLLNKFPRLKKLCYFFYERPVILGAIILNTGYLVRNRKQ
jgi:hypothetical protein